MIILCTCYNLCTNCTNLLVMCFLRAKERPLCPCWWIKSIQILHHGGDPPGKKTNLVFALHHDVWSPPSISTVHTHHILTIKMGPKMLLLCFPTHATNRFCGVLHRIPACLLLAFGRLVWTCAEWSWLFSSGSGVSRTASRCLLTSFVRCMGMAQILNVVCSN